MRGTRVPQGTGTAEGRLCLFTLVPTEGHLTAFCLRAGDNGAGSRGKLGRYWV